VNENILQSFKSESAPYMKLLSFKFDSESMKLIVFQTRFVVTSKCNISILPTQLLRAQTPGKTYSVT